MCLFNIICAHLNLFIILFYFFHTHTSLYFIILYETSFTSFFVFLYNIYFLSKKKEYLVYMCIIIINSYTKLVETPFFR